MNSEYGLVENVMRLVSLVIAVVLLARNVILFSFVSPGALILGFNSFWTYDMIRSFMKKRLFQRRKRI